MAADLPSLPAVAMRLIEVETAVKYGERFALVVLPEYGGKFSG